MKPVQPGRTYRYLALGDSYTIGEAVDKVESFPFQVASAFKGKNIEIDVIAKTGWTSGELIRALEVTPLASVYDFVTLLIGVNNQYRGNPKETYRQDFKHLLKIALGKVSGNSDRVIVLSIPDWSVTPFAKRKGWNVTLISSQIDEFNAINMEESRRAGVFYIDICQESRLAALDAKLIASDKLHPSGRMYSSWSKHIRRHIQSCLPLP